MKFQVYRNTAGQHRWRLVETNGQVVPMKIGKIAGFENAPRNAGIERAVDAALSRIASESGSALQK